MINSFQNTDFLNNYLEDISPHFITKVKEHLIDLNDKNIYKYFYIQKLIEEGQPKVNETKVKLYSEILIKVNL